MGFKCGVVGLPNVGKSTVFNTLTRSQVAVANYPFCTIEPNVGVVTVPDLRLLAISEIVKPKRTLPAIVEFVDIAGLVKGASQGEGLGNKFLANIRETQAIAHVVRCFSNGNITHVAGSVDPVRDVETINTELILADLETVEKSIDRAAKAAKGGSQELRQSVDLLKEVMAALNQGIPVRKLLQEDQNKYSFLRSLQLLTAKPVFYVANLDEESLKHPMKNNGLLELKKLADSENTKVVTLCAIIEDEISKLDEEDRKMFLDDLGINEPGLNQVIEVGYDLLGLQTYFTAGVSEVRAWTIKKGTKAGAAAGVIHSDFERGFICAEIIAYQDYLNCRGEARAKELGKLRIEGREYLMQDADVVHFRFNV